jgi:hypothetical protein
MQDDELKAMLDRLDVPPPSAGAQERAANMAMQAFVEQQQKKPKGLADATRPISEAAYGWIGRFTMKKAYVEWRRSSSCSVSPLLIIPISSPSATCLRAAR